MRIITVGPRISDLKVARSQHQAQSRPGPDPSLRVVDPTADPLEIVATISVSPPDALQLREIHYRIIPAETYNPDATGEEYLATEHPGGHLALPRDASHEFVTAIPGVPEGVHVVQSVLVWSDEP